MACSVVSMLCQEAASCFAMPLLAETSSSRRPPQMFKRGPESGRLEDQSAANLNDALVVGCGGDLAKPCGARREIRQTELRSVGRVEGLQAELELRGVGNTDALEDRGIQIVDSIRPKI